MIYDICTYDICNMYDIDIIAIELYLPGLPAGAPPRVALSGAGTGVSHRGPGGVEGGGGGLAVASRLHGHRALGGGRAGGGSGGAAVTILRVRSRQPTVVCWTGRIVHAGSQNSEIKTKIEI